MKKHSNKKRKLDAIEEASVELMSSTAAVSYTFAVQSDDDDDNNCDEATNKHNEMHTIDEVNGVMQDVPGNGSSTTNSGNETTTSNTSDESNDPFETISHPTRSASFPASSTNSVIRLPHFENIRYNNFLIYTPTTFYRMKCYIIFRQSLISLSLMKQTEKLQAVVAFHPTIAMIVKVIAREIIFLKMEMF